MSIDLLAEFEAAKARVDQLRRQIASTPCKAVGHDWQSVGGCNAGCGPYCTCSVPVNACTKCEDCDYGDNEDADDVRKECRAIAAAIAAAGSESLTTANQPQSTGHDDTGR